MSHLSSNDMIAEWLERARWAASGGNKQLWKTTIRSTDGGVEFHVSLPDSQDRLSAADSAGAGAVTSLGCFATCLEEAGAAFGYCMTAVHVMANADLWSTVVQLHFHKQPQIVTKVSLETMRTRRTNRFPYTKQRVPDAVIKAAKDVLLPSTELTDLTVSRKELNPFFEEMTLIRMGNRSLFTELLEEVFWKDEEPNKETDLPSDTLGVSALLLVLMRLTKRRPFFTRSRLVHALSLYQAVHRPLRSASHIFFLGQKKTGRFIPRSLADGWFELGRSFQRVWFVFEQNGVSLQPFAVNLIVVNHFDKSNSMVLDRRDIACVERWHKRLKGEFELDLTSPGIFFRIGYAQHSAPFSPRKKVDAEYQG